MQIQRALEQLGYPRNEISVYVALLQMGEGTVAEITRKVELPRSTTQLVIEELQKKGLVSRCPKRQHVVWLAESPTRFLTDIHEKESVLRKLLPELQSIRREAKEKPVLKYYSGRASIAKMFEEILLTKYPVQVIGSIPEMSRYLGEELVTDFFVRLFACPGQIKCITSPSPLVDKLKAECSSGHNKIVVSDDEGIKHAVYVIFDSNVCNILLGAQESVGVMFENPGMAESSKLFFESLWKDYTK